MKNKQTKIHNTNNMKSLILFVVILFTVNNINAQTTNTPQKETTFLKELSQENLEKVSKLTEGMERFRIPFSTEIGSCPTYIDVNTNEMFVLKPNHTFTEFYLIPQNVEVPLNDRFKGKENKPKD